jgi:hypothetical protein
MDIEITGSKYGKEFLYTALPFVFILFAGIFVIFSIVYDRFIAYSLNTFFYALALVGVWRFYQDALFFLGKQGLEEKEYMYRVHLYNKRFHIANFVLIAVWVWVLMVSKFF